MNTRLFGALAASTMLCGVAQAAIGSVTFTGSVTSVCSLSVQNGAGTLAPSSNLSNLSSKNSGGVAGIVNLNTTGNVTLTVDPATSPIQPPTDVATTLWAPSYSLAGVQTVADTNGLTSIANPGTGAITVNLTATKAGGTAFHTGTYGATVTVRCEP
ncbi:MULTISPECIES: hypothetical protein [unclassified Aureimonas]|uniref:hypothetical protein n=1 Tax=unclassified Aureimonas TaxID=2615206 RepID=UPI000700E393|nr:MULTISPECIES: hypothetical protein [unclassified Aureimonas]KQT64171.1 hypothetical protein ASG62_04040 [Aureimonas sp. Leaf427]KQT81360.1 hypothetical protein ASG54_01310 [Aureimonas sp. Leaf460]